MTKVTPTRTPRAPLPHRGSASRHGDVASTRTLPKRRRWPTRRDGDALFAWGLISPVVIGWLIFVLWPIISALGFSFQSLNLFTGQSAWIGFDNYIRVVSDDGARRVLVTTVTFSTGLVVLNLALALGLASLLNRKFPFRTTFRTLFFSPMVVSLVAWAIVWGMLLRKDGSVNALLEVVGIPGPNWLREEVPAMISVIVVQTIKGVGLNMILFLAALQAIPGELKEAAAIDGAGSRAVFWRIEFPLIAPTVLLASIITILGSLQVFATISVLTAGGPAGSTDVLAYYIYRQGFERHDLGFASALAMVLFAIVLVITAVQWKLRTRWVHHEN